MEEDKPEKTSRLANTIKAQAAEFFNKYANRQALLTVTKVHTSSDLNKATIFLSVLPSEKSKAALDFADRHRADFRIFLKNKARPSHLPKIIFALDNDPKQEL